MTTRLVAVGVIRRKDGHTASIRTATTLPVPEEYTPLPVEPRARRRAIAVRGW